MNRYRLAAFAVVVLVAIAGSVGYLVHAKSDRSRAVQHAVAPATASLAQLMAGPHLIFRDTALGSGYGKLAVVSLANPSGPRAVTDVTCDRVYAVAVRTLCLSSHTALVTTYKATVYTAGLSSQQSLPLAGIPSRARLSLDGTLSATTSFTAGDSYTSTNFSTRTVITPLDSTQPTANLEAFSLIHNGKHITPRDRNYWGVTFAADGVHFYATVAWGGHTWLVRGDMQAHTVTTLHEDAECPSLSPDGTTIVYKKRSGQAAGHWRLAAFTIATGSETLLAETRTVDDQVDWLDNSHVLYGIPRTGAQAATDDIFSVPTDGTGGPSLLIPQAWSPAVVR